MREEVRDPGRLEHIFMAISRIEEFTAGINYEQFLANKLCLYAVTYQIQIIGEATYKLTKEFRARHPEVPWKLMEGMRHVIVHDYYTVNPRLVWNVVVKNIPELKPQIQQLLSEYTEQDGIM